MCGAELVDTWTESCNSEEYIETLLRLIDGICFNEDGVIHFKEDEVIYFDKFFSFMGEVKQEDGTISRRSSELAEHAKVKRKPAVLSLHGVLELIGRLYQDKNRSDQWIDAKETQETAESGKSSSARRQSTFVSRKTFEKVRFDAFVLRHFRSIHGTKGIARRQLRKFVVSVQTLATEHPRVEVFRKLCGIPGLVPEVDEPFIPSLVVRYVIPLLQKLCGKEELGKWMNGGDVLTAPMQKVIEYVELNLAGVYFGGRMVQNFKDNCESKCAVAGGGVDVDEALALAYPLFVYSDSMRAFSHVRAARIIQRWFTAGLWPPYNREEEEDMPAVAVASPRLKLTEAIAKDAEIIKLEWRKECDENGVTSYHDYGVELK